MKRLTVKKLDFTGIELDYSNLANELNDLDWNAIDEAPWKEEFPYTPQAKFQIAYDQNGIYLHYDIDEEFVKGEFIRPNENIWEDSCVEFFVSFDGRKTYYNLEFNVLGTGLIGYGTAEKSSRNRLSAEEILTVDAISQIKTVNGRKNWKQILIIPFALFGLTIADIEGKTLAANFYKCGDGLPNPHFLSWNTIENSKPNFHLPEFFGEIIF
ncbi:carbohydrate-binding family 9-like protein [Sphingobacterium daejeonense]|uniref:carbohydrate-binding family 9-like protein n=1 Tax=Sphingobacterium daejeonense TaxID=371142 RepID=UPI0010C583F5|nr:carbohydrate-binding family 9-like protein [Sphingobacterium daejeonense]VTP98522.1 Uncharacterised protein [Sphingobacterium daejeonense]